MRLFGLTSDKLPRKEYIQSVARFSNNTHEDAMEELKALHQNSYLRDYCYFVDALLDKLSILEDHAVSLFNS